jgi:ATP-binding cassette, subfamily C (CFTR/MRP), member 1
MQRKVTQPARSSIVPEYNINCFSTYTFSIVNKLISYGSSSNNQINIEDIPYAPLYQTSEATDNAFDGPWNKELLHMDPDIRKALFSTHGYLFWFAFFKVALFISLSALQPYFITILLEYVSTKQINFFGMQSGVGIAVVLGMISFVNAFVLNAAMYRCYCFAMGIKSSLIGRIFRKSLVISNYVKENRSVGEIITLMSVDVERIYYGTLMAPWLILSPVMIIVATVLLLIKMSYTALLVCVCIFCLGLSLEDVSKRIGAIRVEIVQHTVERTLLVNETLQGIRVVKMYAWESIIQEKIEKVRKREVILLRKYLILKIISTVNALQCTQ